LFQLEIANHSVPTALSFARNLHPLEVCSWSTTTCIGYETLHAQWLGLSRP
jgi:hypothetical protein